MRRRMMFGFDPADYATLPASSPLPTSRRIGIARPTTTQEPTPIQETGKSIWARPEMLELMGEPPATAKPRPDRDDIETPWRRLSAHPRGAARSAHLFHKMKAVAARPTPSFRWSDYSRRESRDLARESTSVNRVLQAVGALLESHAWTTEDLPALHLVHAKAAYLSRVCERPLRFLQKYLRGIEQCLRRWKRCVRQVDGDLGEAWQCSLQTFAPKQAAGSGHDQGCPKRPWRTKSSNCRGWARTPRSGPSKSCMEWSTRSAIRTSARLSLDQDSRDDYSAT